MKKESLSVRFLYQTIPGRLVLKVLTRPFLSKAAGAYLDSRLSRWLVPLFIKRHKIDMEGFEKKYRSFNSFFTRKRCLEEIDITPEHLISPCDGYLSIYPVSGEQSYHIKHVEYRLEELLKSRKLAKRFAGGTCLIFRLTPQDYHRYCYVSDGVVRHSRAIPGKLHCVRPIACGAFPVYAENSRETFRKQALHHFRNAALVEDNGKATNSPNYRYRITEETLQMIRVFQTSEWQKSVSRFLKYHEKLVDMYTSKKKMTMMPVRINGTDFQFSTGKHNELQKAIIEEFAPRFAPNSECLYVGDTIEKDLVKNVDKLKKVGFEITLHDKMPDVVLYREDKNWIYFVESVTSVGPMDAKRILEIAEMTKNVTAGKIFVTAFLDFKTYKRFSETLAWETEVWIAEMPEHMIHLNGDKFLGPR